MDLEEFDNDLLTDEVESEANTVSKALELFDGTWYTNMNRRGRWMDLIGDYAGSEPFVIDGEALLQYVLDDPLLALARPNELSFQLTHALHSLEQIVGKFISRSAVFNIAFWEDNRHLTLKTGNVPFVVTSRILARRLLFNHMLNLGITVHAFESLNDPNWIKFERSFKPMFIMTNDGGLLDKDDALSSERVLCQRMFVFQLISSGTAVTLLNGAEFRDSKIFSFIYESSRDLKAGKIFSPSFLASLSTAKKTLDRYESAVRCSIKQTALQVQTYPDEASADELTLLNLCRQFLSRKPSNSTRPELLYAFIAHGILLKSLPSKERAQALETIHPEIENDLMHSFLPNIFVSLDNILSTSNISIEVDGRIFISLIHFMTECNSPIREVIGPTVFSQVEAIWSRLNITPVNFAEFAGAFPPPTSSRKTTTQAPPPQSFLLPFENELFDSELASIRVKVDNQLSETSSTHMDFCATGTIFSDTQHWHNAKRAILPAHMGGKDAVKPMTGWQRKKFLKSEQRFMATLQRQAATLTGALGATLQQIVIVPVGSSTSNPKSRPAIKERPSTKQKTKDPKAKPLSSKQKLLEKIAKEKQAGQEDSSQLWWREQVAIMKKMSVSKQASHLRDLLRNKKRVEDRHLFAEMRLYEIGVELQEWIAENEPEAPFIHDRYTVSIMRKVKDIYDQGTVTPAVSVALRSVLISLGFSDYSASFDSSASGDASPDRPNAFDFVKLIRSKSKSPVYEFMHITEDPIVWQLRVFGEFMDRSMDSAVDPKGRVAFKPDAWQREVLDSIDENCSLLVVAPTSAGKTFISYYAMEKVLRGSDDGILVYVAPTKALVTQIAAEVYARFSKDLNGRSCWAVHTRDYRIHDPQKCQILVTVPEMLATMLLSPPLAKVWTPRIKSIILDEIHTIGQQEGGAVWEQIILLAPCPIIGLSATIGSPEIFDKWLRSVQEAHGFKYRFISHPHRYSHLRKFTYAIQARHDVPFQGLDSWKSTDLLRFLHPIGMLSFGMQSLPADLALEASDTLSLYKALLSAQDKLSVDFKALNPTSFFPGNFFLRQKDIIRYEVALKEVLSALMASCDPRDSSSDLHTVIRHLQDPVLSRIPEKKLKTNPSKNEFKTTLLTLVSDLHVQGDLPAILFNFDRTECEIMAKCLLKGLTHAESEWRETNPKWNRKIRAWEAWKIRAKDRERATNRLEKQKGDPDAEPAGNQETSWESSFDPEDPSSQFSFTGIHTSYSKSDLDEDTRQLAWTSTPEWALSALRRGIAVHHAGMNKRYRSLIESLFRLGYVRIVIATGTLALGINAPTKTSVFCGDSPYLTALMYRQCAGRAGRRGYDLLGKVVFYGVAMDRVQRIILSKLPSLGGNFPLTSTLTLRLLNLLDGSDYAPVSVNAVRSLLKLPQVSFGSDIGKDQLLHHVRFSIDYLRRARLLDVNGRPMNLFGIAAHLYYSEPSNLALIALLRRGVIHEICSQNSTIKAQRDIILILSHLFDRKYLPKSYTTSKNLERLGKLPSVVLLPPLPDNVRETLEEHDDEILGVFSGYALAYVNQYPAQLGPDCVLPLSKQVIDGDKSDNQPGLFQHRLRDTAIRVVARSLFVANSGHGDTFHSIEELTRTCRRNLHLNEHAIPSMERITSEGGTHALNAYILDFYTHGQVSTIVKANGIRRGDIWYLFQDFDLALRTICTAIEQLLLQASREAAETDEADSLDIDSGYGTLDPAEIDADEERDPTSFKRPTGVSDKDWRVYEVISGAAKEFNEKFKAMWA